MRCTLVKADTITPALDSQSPALLDTYLMEIFFSVGEPSGDQHAAHLMEEIERRRPDVTFSGFGGPLMEIRGCRLLYRLTDLAVMFIWSVIPVLFGWMVVFRDGKDEKKMVVQEEGYEGRAYYPFWYSLDLFLPFIDLQSAKVWIPRSDCWFRLWYMRIHTLAGWMLVPIGLAALTGLIK